MCGIAGFVQLHTRWSQDALETMTERLHHRGPDAVGLWMEGSVGLGHRRLSILDLSDAANQPMHAENGRYVMVFNGEVYNFRELVEEWGLHHLHTSGDTEVILEGFARFGPKVVQQFNGMFAIALWDKQEETLHLFRDRVGIKPLYLFRQDGDLAFASELKAIRALPGLADSLTINPSAVSAFLHLTYIPHPLTIYREVETLPPGHHAMWHKGAWTSEPFWSLVEAMGTQKVPVSPEAAEEKLHALLQDAVRYRMIADVPTGTFLSGGIDSSLVTALAAEHSETPIRTFSIGFDNPRFDESAYAKSVAEHLKTDHTAFQLSLEEASSRMDDILASYDEPFGDSSSIPTMLVSELARKQVTVILSGDGGDETHMGYGAYTWAKRLDNPLLKTFRKPAAWALSQFSDRYKRVANLFRFDEAAHLPSHIFSQEQYAFRRNELASCLLPPWRADFVLNEHPGDKSVSASENQALFDFHHYLPDDLLVKVDRASMRVGLEVRVPLLDHRLAAFAFSLPETWRKQGDISKYFLKQVLYRYVPPAIFDRPKWGFGVPVSDWLRGPWRSKLDHYISEDVLAAAGFVEPNYALQIKGRFLAGEHHLYVRLWLLLLLHKWYLEHHQPSSSL